MHFDASQRLALMIREAKEAKFKELITRGIGWTADPAAKANIAEVTLIARSPDSPVARAVTALGRELAAAGITVRSLLCDVDHGFSAPADTLTLLEAPNACVRALTDPRYVDVHEQMVIGEEFAWIGDCMRRDPLKRDALETFAGTDPARIASALKSFDRLWSKGQPVPRIVSTATADTIVAGQATKPETFLPSSRS